MSAKQSAKHAITAIVLTCDKKPEEILHAVVKRVEWADQIIIADKGKRKINWPLWAEPPLRQHLVLDWSPVVEPSRNEAISVAIHDWIVMLDDDEILAPDCEWVFREFIKRNTGDVLEIPIKHYILGRFDPEAPYWPEWRPALHRRGSLEFNPQIHAGVRPTKTARVVRVHETSPVYIDHLSHANISSWFEKTNRYTDYPERKTTGKIETNYIGAIMWLRQEYDKIDAFKRWEEENFPNGEAEFLRIALEVLRG